MNALVSIALVFSLAATAAGAGPAPPFSEVRFEQRIGATLPLETEVVDTRGAKHALRDYFRGRPVVLYFGYAGCPQLCPVVADGTVSALRQIRAEVGRDIDVIAISIDPKETAAAAQARLNEAVHRYGVPRAAAGWNYLRGSEEAVRAITDAAGFHFVRDPRSGQYAHPSGFVVVTPAGVLSRYFPGVDFEASEVVRAIARAGRGETGEPVLDRLLRCFRGDEIGGRYGTVIWRTLAAAVCATVLALAAGIGRLLYQERRKANRPTEDAT